jgi:hypothetical protein
MNREDIIRMANKAYGIDEENKPFHPSALLHLEIFAKLVAEHEREACAKLIEECNWPKWADATDARDVFAEAIRARGQT